MTEQIGDWHAVLVTATDDEYGDGLDYAVEHPDSCPKEEVEFVLAQTWSYDCDLGIEISTDGFASFGITEPGTYRVRVHFWPGDGWEIEPDAEIEAIATDSDAMTGVGDKESSTGGKP